MRLPIKALKELANKYGYSVVVAYAYDAENKMQHIATWGKTIKLCDQAAQWGNMMKDALGWPEGLRAQPSRVEKLQNERDDYLEKWKRTEENLSDALKEHDKLLNAVKEHFQVTQIPTSMLRPTEKTLLDLIGEV